MTMAQRLTKGVIRGEQVTISVDGRAVQAFAGETLATLLMIERVAAFNQTRGGQPRAPYCNMGTCFECQVKVANGPQAAPRWVRACMTPVVEGLCIETGAILGNCEHRDEND